VRGLKVVGLVVFLIAIGLVGAGGAAAADGKNATSTGASETASQCDPCVFVWVVRVGAGSVTSNNPAGGNSDPINCGTKCWGAFYSWTEDPVLTPGGDFKGWEGTDTTPGGCPQPEGTRCIIPRDGNFYCIRAIFSTDPAAPTVGECPPPALPPPPPGTGPQTPPPPNAKCTITGTSGPETLRGTVANDVICGLGGNDVIYGLGGDDLLRGGGGNDKLYGGPGNDKLYGNGGRDRLDGGGGNDLLNGGAGADTLLGRGGADTLYARDRTRDVVNGGFGRDRARVDRVDVRRSIERRF
jgi:Ca2+-binding RTX toxin-like protein